MGDVLHSDICDHSNPDYHTFFCLTMEDRRRNVVHIPPHQSSNIRRNLFSTQMNRRNNSTVTRSMSIESLAECVTDVDNSEIAVRSADGCYQFSIPSPPASEDTRTPEQEADCKLSEMLTNRSRQSSESGNVVPKSKFYS